MRLNRANNVSPLCKLPSVNNASDAGGTRLPCVCTTWPKVLGDKLMEIAIKPDSFKPIMEINSPIPTVIATFIEAGIPTTIICRIDVSVKTRNTRPEMNTAPSAVCHDTPIPRTTVKE